jgi:hypothetical protein
LAHQTTFSTTFLAINESPDESHTSPMLNLADLDGSDLAHLLGDLNPPPVLEEEEVKSCTDFDDEDLL